MAQSSAPRPQWSPPIHPPSFPSGANDSNMPAAKRQKLSPNPPSNSSYPQPAPFPASPYTNMASYRNFQLPQGAFPQRSLPNGASSPPIKTEATPMQNGIMGPPQRPSERLNFQQQTHTSQMQQSPQPQGPAQVKAEKVKERVMDINDLSDLVTSSGIDISQEEEAMQSSFQNRVLSTSSYRPNQSFDLAQSGNLGMIGSRGHLHQDPIANPEEELERKQREAARKYAEKNQFELANPFLLAQSARVRMESIANKQGVKLPMEGLFDRIKDRGTTGQTMSNGDTTIAALKAPSLLNKGVALDSILSLLSLAANDRCRSLLEDAYGLARARQITTDGNVPPEWQDLIASASGQESQPAKAKPQSFTQSPWDDTTLNGSVEAANPSATTESQETITFLPKGRSMNVALTDMIKRDRAAEEARLKKRQQRRQKKQDTNGVDSPTSSSQTEADSTAAAAAAAIRAADKPMTKKEQEKARKAEVLSETQQTRAANTTMSMQLGGRKYDWLTKGAGAKGSTPLSKPGAGLGGIATPPNREQANKAGLPSSARDRKFGVWREDGAGGRHVQLRDWINVLESDGKEKKTLYFAISKLGRERDESERPFSSTSR